MAHHAQQVYVNSLRDRLPRFFHNSRVLEVGSYDVNGSIRHFFEEPVSYIGIDLAPGKAVDMVCHGADFHSDEYFDVVASTECFEHDPRWMETFTNMIELCRSGGLVFFTCAANHRQEHGTPRTSPNDSAKATEYYRNLNIEDFDHRLLRNRFAWYLFEANGNDLYFAGVKR